MKIANRFTIAIHIVLLIEYFKGQYKITSEFIAGSVQVHPVIVRQILGQLKKAKLVEVQAGSGGATLTKSADCITLFDIFYAVEPLDKNILFGFHEKPSLVCPVGKNIHTLLDKRLTTAQIAMENSLKESTLADLLQELTFNKQ